MLTAEWTHRIPLLQRTSPADMASNLLVSALDELDTRTDTHLSVVDFCSGGGGPTPTIEQLVNAKRKASARPPIPFVLSDIHPHLDEWIKACSHSANLSFVPQPVDATNPPPAVISQSSPPATGRESPFHSDTRVFRLYCLAFHHFNDIMARKVLRSTMETSDGFAIIELQDRRLSSLILMMADFFLIFVVSLLWFWKDPLMLLLTYVIPIMPFIMSFDGAVSSLRTRTFQEVLALMDHEESGSTAKIGAVTVEMEDDGVAIEVARRGEWVFKSGRQMHTWPIGYMNWIVGYRKPER